MRPIVECASPAWDPNNTNVVEKVESVERKAEMFMVNDHNWDSCVAIMIKELNINSTELRQKVEKVKLLHSILIQNTILSSHLIPTRAEDLIKFKPVHARIQSYALSFIQSVTNEWNSLPTSLLREIDIKAFESKL